LKSSGTPYLLFCTQINDTNYCFLIDKKIKDGYDFPKIFIVHYRFDPCLFQGTLFETELLRDKNNQWSLLLGDIYSYEGRSMGQVQISDRMNHCISIMETQYKNDSFCDICPIRIKRYFDIQDVQSMIDTFIPNLSYRIRGLYFVPLKTSYSNILYLFNDNDYKNTNSTKKNLITFRIIQTPTPEVYELYLYNEQKTMLQKHSYASIPDIQTSRWVKELTDSEGDSNVQCSYNSLFKKWVPLKQGTGPDTVVDCPRDT